MTRSTIPSLLLLLILISISNTTESRPTTPTTIKFIKTSCSTTTYPLLCVQSLSIYSKAIQQSPRQMAHTALNVSLSKAQRAHKFVRMCNKFKGLKRREYEAIKDCIYEMEDTVDRLGKSVDELNKMGGSKADFLWHMSNVQTWVSAALTDEATCLDGFSGQLMNGKIKASIRAQVVHLAQVTSNALALINKFAAA